MANFTYNEINEETKNNLLNEPIIHSNDEIESQSSDDQMMLSPSTSSSPSISSERPDHDDINDEITKMLEKADSDNSNDNYIPGTFEGPEKNLCVEFKPNIGHINGCRELDRQSLDAICAAAKCTIMSSISNQYVDAYVLSESSLFVFQNKIILKTCGTTTLLRCLMPLLKFTDNLGLIVDWVGYSRKNFIFPEAQYFPHSNFNEEFEYLKRHPQLEQRVSGEGYVLGPITKDHWLTYVCDRSYDSQFLSDDVTLNIMMFDLDEKITPLFYKENNPTANDMTMSSGISNLVPGAIIDDCAFEPCGYSMNSILHDTYSTIHITPEKECSYASFETNTPLKSYTSLIKNVLNVFKPGRIVITMIADECGLKKVIDSPFVHKLITPSFGTYTRSSISMTDVAGDCMVQMGNWELTSKEIQQVNNRPRTLSM